MIPVEFVSKLEGATKILSSRTVQPPATCPVSAHCRGSFIRATEADQKRLNLLFEGQTVNFEIHTA